LLFENSTNTLVFRPLDEYTAGQTYYFSIVIKEKNSKSVLYAYYCTLKMKGVIKIRDDSIKW